MKSPEQIKELIKEAIENETYCVGDGCFYIELPNDHTVEFDTGEFYVGILTVYNIKITDECGKEIQTINDFEI